DDHRLRFELDLVVELVHLRVGLVLAIEGNDLVADVAHELLDRVDRAGLKLVEQGRNEIDDLALRFGRHRGGGGERGRNGGARDQAEKMSHALAPFCLSGLFVARAKRPMSPVIMRTTSSAVVVSVATLPATTPWRSTTMRSATAKACAMT